MVVERGIFGVFAFCMRFVSDAVYVDLKYDDVFVLWLIVVCEWVGGSFVSDGLCLVLLLRFVWVCEWCISSQVCTVTVLSVCISDEPSVCLVTSDLSFMEIPHIHLIICISALSHINPTSTSKGL